MSVDRVSDAVRCDGCGVVASGAKKYTDDSDNVVATLCVGCQDLKDIRGDDPADIEQYEYGSK